VSGLVNTFDALPINSKDYRDNPLLLLTTMKFSLALVLVSLSVLTAAKHEFVCKANGNHNPSEPCPPPLVPGKGNECLPAPKHEFVCKANGNYNPGQQGGNGASPSVAPANANGGKGNGGTPANSQPKETGTGSTLGKSLSGWVQNPSGTSGKTSVVNWG